MFPVNDGEVDMQRIGRGYILKGYILDPVTEITPMYMLDKLLYIVEIYNSFILTKNMSPCGDDTMQSLKNCSI